MDKTLRFVIAGLLATSMVFCLSRPACADAAGKYQGIYGEKEKDALRKGPKAQVELAAELLEDAKSLDGDKDLQAYVREKAYEFGLTAPAGYPTAAEAMRSLTEAAPDDQKAAAEDKLLVVVRLLYARSKPKERPLLGEELVDLLLARGEKRAEAKKLYEEALSIAKAVLPGRVQEITDRIKELKRAEDYERLVADLKAKLESDPSNTAVRTTLLLAYLGEGDNPAEAVNLLTADLDEGLRTYVPLAAKKVEDLSEAQSLDLPKWYTAIAEKVSPAGKSALLGKAKRCIEQFLTLHPTEDAGRLAALKLLKEVEDTIKKVGGWPAKELVLTLGKEVTIRLVRIPAGKFVMGSPETEAGRKSDEGPQHLVTISKPFYMGVCLVTQAQYEAVMGRNPSRFTAPDNPVDNVSWDAAVEFCKKLSEKTKKTVRLPTEAEWEYGCRAGTTTAYPFGDDASKLGDYAWFSRNADGKAHPVGQKKPNPWGLRDMEGNVWEWCSDWYAGSYAKAKTMNPRGPDSGTNHVLRGGAWSVGPQHCRSANRDSGSPAFQNGYYGFRLVVGEVGAD